MVYQKLGLPEENELVICKVKKILPHSVFVTLDEYNKKEGMVHISEISPGRIRNLRDFVREGKTIVCKVLSIKRDRGQIDLSLRRVSIPLRKKKEEEYKQEQKAEKLLELVAKKEGITLNEIYQKAGTEIFKRYTLLNQFFNEIIVNEKEAIKDLKIDKKLLDTLIKTVKEKIKLPEVKLEIVVHLSTMQEGGLEKIKKAFEKTKALAKQNKYNLEIRYISAPKYKLTVTSSDYKTAEKNLREISDNLLQYAKENNIEAEWQKKS